MRKGFVIGLLFFATQIGVALAQTCTLAPAGAVSWYPADGNANDVISSNNGILQNGATFGAGWIKQAFTLDGTDDRIDVADTSSLNPGGGGFTIEAWVFKTKMQSSGAVAPVMSKHVGDFSHGFLLSAGSGGNLLPTTDEIIAIAGDGSSHRIVIETGVLLTQNTWTHLAMTYDAITKTLNVYKNGVLIGSGSNSTVGTINPTGQLFRIGSYNRISLNRIETFPGLIDEAAYYSRALTTSEIQTIANAGNAGKCKFPDTTLPTFTTIPANVTAATGAGATVCGTFISDAALGSAAAKDDFPGQVTIQRSGVPAGNIFPVGETTITYKAIDAAGNFATATQKVTVVDDTAPTITAPPDVTKLVLSAPVALSAADLGSPTAVDNCAILSVTNNAPATFPAGVTTVTYTARDTHGNSNTATQNVTVVLQKTATVRVQMTLHTTGKPGSIKTPLNTSLKVFDLAKLGSFSPKDYGAIWNSGAGLAAASISGSAVVSTGDGQTNLYNVVVPSADTSNSSTASGSYFVVGQALVNGEAVYVGRRTDPLPTGSVTNMVLQILDQNGKLTSQ